MRRSKNEDTENLDIEVILGQLDIKFQTMGREAKFSCPFHSSRGGRSETLYLRIDSPGKGLWHCFSTACEEKGNIVTFVSKLKEISYKEACSYLGLSRYTVSLEPNEALQELRKLAGRIDGKVRGFSPTTSEQEAITLPEWCNEIDPRLAEYLQSRAFQEPYQVIEKNQLSVCRYGYYASRVIVPVWNQTGMLVSFCGRSLYDQQPKILNCRGVPCQRLLLGEHQLADMREWSNVLTVVEGPFDYLKLVSLHIPAVCTFGSKLSSIQATRIIRSPFQEYLMGYDMDEAGMKGMEEAMGLLGNYAPVQALLFDPGKDAGDLVSREEFWEIKRGTKDAVLYQNRIRSQEV